MALQRFGIVKLMDSKAFLFRNLSQALVNHKNNSFGEYFHSSSFNPNRIQHVGFKSSSNDAGVFDMIGSLFRKKPKGASKTNKCKAQKIPVKAQKTSCCPPPAKCPPPPCPPPKCPPPPCPPPPCPPPPCPPPPCPPPPPRCPPPPCPPPKPKCPPPKPKCPPPKAKCAPPPPPCPPPPCPPPPCPPPKPKCPPPKAKCAPPPPPCPPPPCPPPKPKCPPPPCPPPKPKCPPPPCPPPKPKCPPPPCPPPKPKCPPPPCPPPPCPPPKPKCPPPPCPPPPCPPPPCPPPPCPPPKPKCPKQKKKKGKCAKYSPVDDLKEIEITDSYYSGVLLACHPKKPLCPCPQKTSCPSPSASKTHRPSCPGPSQTCPIPGVCPTCPQSNYKCPPPLPKSSPCPRSRPGSCSRVAKAIGLMTIREKCTDSRTSVCSFTKKIMDKLPEKAVSSSCPAATRSILSKCSDFAIGLPQAKKICPSKCPPTGCAPPKCPYF